jgi:hypothetical protein
MREHEEAHAREADRERKRRQLDRPRKLDSMPLERGNTLVVLSRPRVVAAESDCMNCKPQINFVVGYSWLGVCFLSVTGTYRVPCVSYESLQISSPTDQRGHNTTLPYCFGVFPQSHYFDSLPTDRRTHHSPFFYIYHPSLRCLSTTNCNGFREWR